MKILHTSDLHIGKRVNEYSMLEEQKYILNKILDIAKEEQPNAFILAGDIYDKSVPSAEAVSLFDASPLPHASWKLARSTCHRFMMEL